MVEREIVTLVRMEGRREISLEKLQENSLEEEEVVVMITYGVFLRGIGKRRGKRLEFAATLALG